MAYRHLAIAVLGGFVAALVPESQRLFAQSPGHTQIVPLQGCSATVKSIAVNTQSEGIDNSGNPTWNATVAINWGCGGTPGQDNTFCAICFESSTYTSNAQAGPYSGPSSGTYVQTSTKPCGFAGSSTIAWTIDPLSPGTYYKTVFGGAGIVTVMGSDGSSKPGCSEDASQYTMTTIMYHP